MERTVNKPIAGTFGWLNAGATRTELPDAEEKIRRLVLEDGEDKVIVYEDEAAAGEFDILLGENSTLSLIQIRREGSDRAEQLDIRVRCMKNAHFHWFRLHFGGGRTYDNCSVQLTGDGSTFTADMGYRLKDDDIYDVNCEAVHEGKGSQSAIRAYGSLADRAGKLLRGTIDFRTGCSGAEGNETEDVLLIDDTVNSRSVPMILCAEEDVVGNHGATIGRPDENMLFYMETRGLSPEKIYEMMSQAKMDVVIRKLPDERLRAELGTSEDGYGNGLE